MSPGRLQVKSLATSPPAMRPRSLASRRDFFTASPPCEEVIDIAPSCIPCPIAAQGREKRATQWFIRALPQRQNFKRLGWGWR
jgi:hypothetical protein